MIDQTTGHKIYFPEMGDFKSGRFPKKLNFAKSDVFGIDFAENFNKAQQAKVPFYLVSVIQWKNDADSIRNSESKKLKFNVFDTQRLYACKHQLQSSGHLKNDKDFRCPKTNREIEKIYFFSISCFKFEKNEIVPNTLESIGCFNHFFPKQYDPKGVDETFVLDALNFNLILRGEDKKKEAVTQVQEMIFLEVCRSVSILKRVENEILPDLLEDLGELKEQSTSGDMSGLESSGSFEYLAINDDLFTDESSIEEQDFDGDPFEFASFNNSCSLNTVSSFKNELPTSFEKKLDEAKLWEYSFNQ